MKHRFCILAWAVMVAVACPMGAAAEEDIAALREGIEALGEGLELHEALVDMLDNPAMAGHMGIVQIKELAAKNKAFEEGAEELLDLAKQLKEPILRRSALFAAAELQARAGQPKEAVETLIQLVKECGGVKLKGQSKRSRPDASPSPAAGSKPPSAPKRPTVCCPKPAQGRCGPAAGASRCPPGGKPPAGRCGKSSQGRCGKSPQGRCGPAAGASRCCPGGKPPAAKPPAGRCGKPSRGRCGSSARPGDPCGCRGRSTSARPARPVALRKSPAIVARPRVAAVLRAAPRPMPEQIARIKADIERHVRGKFQEQKKIEMRLRGEVERLRDQLTACREELEARERQGRGVRERHEQELRKAHEDLKRKARELDERAKELHERAEQTRREIGGKVEGVRKDLEERKRELRRVGEQLEQRSRELDRLAEELKERDRHLNARAEELEKLTEEVERRQATQRDEPRPEKPRRAKGGRRRGKKSRPSRYTRPSAKPRR